MHFSDCVVLLHRGRFFAIRHTDDGVPYLLPQTMQPAAR